MFTVIEHVFTIFIWISEIIFSGKMFFIINVGGQRENFPDVFNIPSDYSTIFQLNIIGSGSYFLHDFPFPCPFICCCWTCTIWLGLNESAWKVKFFDLNWLLCFIRSVLISLLMGMFCSVSDGKLFLNLLFMSNLAGLNLHDNGVFLIINSLHCLDSCFS